MKTIPDNLALKEWAAVVAALGAGDQIVLVRKGGLADRNFGVQSDEFLLFPSYFHQPENRFKPEFAHYVEATKGRTEDSETVEITHWCRVAKSFAIRDLDRLLAVSPFVIFADDTIRERYAFRQDQAAHVIVVRTFALPEAISIENKRGYGGCRSWIKLSDVIDTERSQVVLSDAEFAKRAAEIENAIASVAAASN